MSTQQFTDVAAPPAETPAEAPVAPVEEGATPVAAQQMVLDEKLDLTGLLHKVCEGQPTEVAEQLFAQVAGIAERVKNGDDKTKIAEEKASELTKTIEALQQKVDITNEEAKQKADEEARLQAEEVEIESRKRREWRERRQSCMRQGSGQVVVTGGGQGEIAVSFMAADFADIQDGDGGGISNPSAGDVNMSGEEEEEEEDESTDDDVMEDEEEMGEGGEERPIARRAQKKRGRKKKKKKKRGVQPTEPLQILNAEETKDL